MEDILFFLEIMGTVAFAISGAVLGIRKRMDIFGVSILGLTTGVGGGIIRDLIVGNNPPLTFQDPVYLVVSIITSIIVFLPVIRTWIFRETRFYEALMLLFDSIGLGIFTVNGIQTAYQSTNIHGIILLAFVGVITGCGGGVLRDMMAGAGRTSSSSISTPAPLCWEHWHASFSGTESATAEPCCWAPH